MYVSLSMAYCDVGLVVLFQYGSPGCMCRPRWSIMVVLRSSSISSVLLVPVHIR